MTESAYQANGDVGVLTLSNPPANLFTLEVGEDIRAGIERAREEAARAMVIQADGAVFSGEPMCRCSRTVRSRRRAS